MIGNPPDVGNTGSLAQRNCKAKLLATWFARVCVESRVYRTLCAFSKAVSVLIGTWPSMRCACTICPVGLRMKTLTAMLFLVAKSTQACVIFAAVSAEISYLISVFLAASSEMTNLLMFCPDTVLARIANAAMEGILVICIFMICSLSNRHESLYPLAGEHLTSVDGAFGVDSDHM